MKSRILFKVFIVCCLTLVSVVSVYTRESTRVSCYTGDPANNQQLGDLETFDVANAAGLCNNVFYDYNGKCTACYTGE